MTLDTSYITKGIMYDPSMDRFAITVAVRSSLKKVFSDPSIITRLGNGYKFSVSSELFRTGWALKVVVTEGPLRMFKDKEDTYVLDLAFVSKGLYSDKITWRANEVMSLVNAVVKAYNYDAGNIDTDYEDYNFVPRTSIGDYDRPYRKVE